MQVDRHFSRRKDGSSDSAPVDPRARLFGATQRVGEAGRAEGGRMRPPPLKPYARLGASPLIGRLKPKLAVAALAVAAAVIFAKSHGV